MITKCPLAWLGIVVEPVDAMYSTRAPAHKSSFVVAIESPLSQHLACNRGVFKAKFDLASGTFSGAITQGGKVTAQMNNGEVTATEIEETPASKSAEDKEEASGDTGGVVLMGSFCVPLSSSCPKEKIHSCLFVFLLVRH